MARATISDVRVGRHECFDRMVVDLDGDVAGWSVRYVPAVVRDGSGAAVALRGAGDLEVVVRAPAYDEDGARTWAGRRAAEAADVRGFTTFRQVAWPARSRGSRRSGSACAPGCRSVCSSSTARVTARGWWWTWPPLVSGQPPGVAPR